MGTEVNDMGIAIRTAIGAMLLLIVSGLAGADGVLSLESTSGPTGGNATVKVFQKGAKETGSLDIEISFKPEAMEFLEVETAEGADNAMIEANAVSPGRIKIAMMDLDGLSVDGAVMTLHFKINAADGETIPIKIVSASANHFDALVEIPLTTEDGQLKVVTDKPLLHPMLIQILVGAASLIIILCLLRAYHASRKRQATS
jgi:hypothetical protein